MCRNSPRVSSKDLPYFHPVLTLVHVRRLVRPFFVVHARDERVPGVKRGVAVRALFHQARAGSAGSLGPGGQGPEVGGCPLGIVGTAAFCGGEQV